MDTFGYTNSSTSTFDNSSRLQYGVEDTEVNLTEQQLAEQLNDEFRLAVLPVTIFVGLEVILGFLGNLVVLCVFSFRYHVCNFRYFVLCLAFIDILSSLTTMPGEMYTLMNWHVYHVREVCKVKTFLNVFTLSAEMFCLLTIAVDRYRKVCQPLRWQIKPRIARNICGVIYFIAFLLSFPVSIFWGLHSHPKTYRDVLINVTICEKDEQFKDTKHPLVYSAIMQMIVSVCLLVMLCLYILVARKLFKGKRQENSSGSPIEVITPVPDTGVPSGAEAVFIHSDASDTGYSSGVYNKAVPTKEIKVDCINSNDETEPPELGTTLAVHSGVCKNQVSVDKKKVTLGRPRKPRDKMTVSGRVRRKTLIMFILTVTFIATTILYSTLLAFIARSDNVLQDMSHSGKAAYFFFLRLYFLNHVINPVVYGLLDPRFKKVMRNSCSARWHSVVLFTCIRHSSNVNL